MTDPSADDRWNGKYERNEENAFAIRDSKDSAKQYQGKQNRNNDISPFDFFDKGEKEEEQREGNEEFDRRNATQS